MRVAACAGHGTISIEKARAALGFEPQVDLEEGMRRTEAWLRTEGLLGHVDGALPITSESTPRGSTH